MSGVRTIIRLCPRQPDVLHDFVLTLPRYLVKGVRPSERRGVTYPSERLRCEGLEARRACPAHCFHAETPSQHPNPPSPSPSLPLPHTRTPLLLLLTLQHRQTRQTSIEPCSGRTEASLDALHPRLPLLAGGSESLALGGRLAPDGFLLLG
jgi:hypothetical protein